MPAQGLDRRQRAPWPAKRVDLNAFGPVAAAQIAVVGPFDARLADDRPLGDATEARQLELLRIDLADVAEELGREVLEWVVAHEDRRLRDTPELVRPLGEVIE